jgi:two-component system, chemotaxis family, CheB/CheR fusion protein
MEAMPPDSGMIFVVVIHLSPSHESTLADLLARSTSMPVVQAQDAQFVEPNHVYVIPPGKYLAAVNGQLLLTPLESDRGRRVAVDLFFRSLADTRGPNAVAIVLSGADGDGALGVKRVKERGGLTIAQDPAEAEYPGMPQSAIETGMIDWVLEVGQIPQRLIKFRDAATRLNLPAEDGPQPILSKTATAVDSEATLRDVLVFLRTRTGSDFSYYKRATILRRIRRRMQINGVDDLPEYLGFLRTHPGEAEALLQDLLISVTNFFRDRDSFESIDRQIPDLFKDKNQHDFVRVWVPACATGEEAYSLAILLLEHAQKLANPPTLQVFACDIDNEAVQVARAGHYPETIHADVSEDRLRRFFVKDHRGYRVRREVREIVLFATHDLLRDAPFSRMDLISCRNLLIYLNRAAQQRVFEIFHFALKPNGLLFLGSSESVDDDSPLFRTIDKKNRIYAQQHSARLGLPVPVASASLLRMIIAQGASTAPVLPGKRFGSSAVLPMQGDLDGGLDRAALTELHFQLIERFSPPSVVVDAGYDIVHLSDNAGRFLKLVGGEPSLNLLRVVHPSLRTELRAALFRAVELHTTTEALGVPVEVENAISAIDIRVSPAEDIAPGFLLVVFDQRPRASAGAVALPAELPPPTTPDSVVRQIERESEQLKRQLRDTIEQYEASTEELKASNEELQAMNEELRSATEELETSREELQSINEELTTVNLEMKGKVDELAHANSDLQNLMASTSIATVFLDRDLSITRYTPNAVEIFRLIPTDVGRPLADLKHRLDYPDLLVDAANVLRTLVPVEREVRNDSRWFLVRLHPYRTQEDHIAGAVLTLVDISEQKIATEAQRESEERYRILIESAKEYAIFTMDVDRRIDSWNPGAVTMFGYSESEMLGQSADILFTPADRDNGDPDNEFNRARDEGRAENERWHARKDGTTFYGSGSVMRLRDKTGALHGYLKIMRNLTESKHAQEALRQHMDELTRFNDATVGREIRMIELKTEVNELCRRHGQEPRYVVKEEPGNESRADS